jgi:8-oxo-dGTP pyrophosphatase MutT (NUDIX family)
MRTIKRDIVGAFILSSDGRLLMGKSRGGSVYADYWIVPGGGVDAGETKLAALKREMLEELGLDISVANINQIDFVFPGQAEKILWGSGERVLADMVFYNFTVEFGQLAADIPIKTEDDFVEAQWFLLKELKDIPVSPPSVTTLKKLGYL